MKKAPETQDYRAAYEAADDELESLMDEKYKIDTRITGLRKTMNALATLISQEDEGFDKQSSEAVMDRLNLSLTDDILNVVSAASAPVTSSDVLEELKKLGCTAIHHSNPLATINSILNRLKERGALEETRKDDRKAWRRKPFGFRGRK